MSDCWKKGWFATCQFMIKVLIFCGFKNSNTIRHPADPAGNKYICPPSILPSIHTTTKSSKCVPLLRPLSSRRERKLRTPEAKVYGPDRNSISFFSPSNSAYKISKWGKWNLLTGWTWLSQFSLIVNFFTKTSWPNFTNSIIRQFVKVGHLEQITNRAHPKLFVPGSLTT